MEKMALKWTLLQMIVISIASAFVNYKFSFGVVLGTGFSLVHFVVLSKNVKSILNNEKTFIGRMSTFFIRLLLLALPLLLSYKFANIFNIYGAFFGLLLHKISLIACTIFIAIRANNDKIE